MQAIRTRYIGPSEVRGSRVTAKCEAGRITMEWDDALDVEDNHRAACAKLCAKLGWEARHYVPGWFDSDCYWVHDDGRLKALQAFVNSMRAGTWGGNPWSRPEFRHCVEAVGRSYGYRGDALGAPTTDDEAAKPKSD
jgi:hypothetical protein